LFYLKSPPGDREFEYYCAARYPMQVTELEVALSDKRVNSEVVSKWRYLLENNKVSEII